MKPAFLHGNYEQTQGLHNNRQKGFAAKLFIQINILFVFGSKLIKLSIDRSIDRPLYATLWKFKLYWNWNQKIS